MSGIPGNGGAPWPGLGPWWYQGNVNLYNRVPVPNPAGGVSTVASVGFEDALRREILIPMVVGGGLLDFMDSIRHYERSGEHLGIFDTGDVGQNRALADVYGQMIHRQQKELGFERGGY